MGNSPSRSHVTNNVRSRIISIQEYEDLSKPRDKKIQEILRLVNTPSEFDTDYSSYLDYLGGVLWFVFLIPSEDRKNVYGTLLVANITQTYNTQLKDFISKFIQRSLKASVKFSEDKEKFCEAYLRNIFPQIFDHNKLVAVYEI